MATSFCIGATQPVAAPARGPLAPRLHPALNRTLEHRQAAYLLLWPAATPSAARPRDALALHCFSGTRPMSQAAGLDREAFLRQLETSVEQLSDAVRDILTEAAMERAVVHKMAKGPRTEEAENVIKAVDAMSQSFVIALDAFLSEAVKLGDTLTEARCRHGRDEVVRAARESQEMLAELEHERQQFDEQRRLLERCAWLDPPPPECEQNWQWQQQQEEEEGLEQEQHGAAAANGHWSSGNGNVASPSLTYSSSSSSADVAEAAAWQQPVGGALSSLGGAGSLLERAREADEAAEATERLAAAAERCAAAAESGVQLLEEAVRSWGAMEDAARQ